MVGAGVSWRAQHHRRSGETIAYRLLLTATLQGQVRDAREYLRVEQVKHSYPNTCSEANESMLDVMVQWEQEPGTRPTIARVSSVASSETLEAPSRDVVTLYGQPTPESLALALAAAVEARKAQHGPHAVRELAVSESTGAVGDAEWRDQTTGQLIRRDLNIPLTVLRETAQDLLNEGGQAIRRLLAGLLMPEWPEGTRRALSFQLATVAAPNRSSDMLAAMREADAGNFDDE